MANNKGGRPRQPRLSVAPLTLALTLAGIPDTALPKELKQSLQTGRTRGYITEQVADEICCDYLKEHPIVVWGEEYVNNLDLSLEAHDLAQRDDETDEEYANFLAILNDEPIVEVVAA